jgi:hypothetical protein
MRGVVGQGELEKTWVRYGNQGYRENGSSYLSQAVSGLEACLSVFLGMQVLLYLFGAEEHGDGDKP